MIQQHSAKSLAAKFRPEIHALDFADLGVKFAQADNSCGGVVLISEKHTTEWRHEFPVRTHGFCEQSGGVEAGVLLTLDVCSHPVEIFAEQSLCIRAMLIGFDLNN